MAADLHPHARRRGPGLALLEYSPSSPAKRGAALRIAAGHAGRVARHGRADSAPSPAAPAMTRLSPARQIDQRQAGIGRRIDPGIQADAAAPAPLSKALISRARHIAARQRPGWPPAAISRYQTQAVRIAGGEIGLGPGDAELVRAGRGPGAAPTIPARRDRSPASTSSRFGNRAMRQAAVALQPPRRILPARPGEIRESRHPAPGRWR